MRFEPTTSGGEGPQTYALDRAATGIGVLCMYGTECLTKWANISFHETISSTDLTRNIQDSPPPTHARACNIKSMSLADDTAMSLITGSQVQPNPTLPGMSGQA